MTYREIQRLIWPYSHKFVRGLRLHCDARMCSGMEKIRRNYAIHPDLIDGLSKMRAGYEFPPTETALVEKAIEEYLLRHKVIAKAVLKRAA